MANGRVTGVLAAAHNSVGVQIPVAVRAPRVIVAAGGIQSPALLLRSGLTLPQIGCNLFLHPAVAVASLYDEPIRAWSGPPQTILSNQFATLDGNYGFRLEAAPAHPGLFAFGAPMPTPVHHRRLMQRVANASVGIALVRDFAPGRVRVRRSGSAVVDYFPGPAERRLMARGTAEMVRIQLAAGAREIHTQHVGGMVFARTDATTQGDIDRFCERLMSAPVDRNRSIVFSAHQMGTCRMGTDPAAAVCDERGAVFGVKGLYIADASAFPSSSGVNPMISVMALARCVAEAVE
jgi:choline dehydrogenase-like flavoprotein